MTLRRPARRLARRLGLALLLASCVPPVAFAAPDLPLRQFVRRVWTTDDGLPQSSVNALAQTPDGYLWVGTSGGLARFDGVRFEVFDPGTRPPLPIGRILALLADPDGSLWIATERDGLWRRSGGRFTAVETEPPLREPIWALARAADGTLWAGTERGAGTLRGAAPARWQLAPGLPAPTWVRSLAVDGEGTLWAATDRGTAAFDGQAFRWRGAKRPVWALAGGSAGGLSAVDERGGVTVLAGAPFATPLDELAPIAPRSALAARDGSLWVGGLGLARLAGGRLRVAPIEAGIVDARVLSLFEDREGNVWLGLDGGGLARFRPGRVVTYGWDEGLGTDSVLPVLEDRAGVIWIGGNCGGLWRLRAGLIAPRPGADGRPLECVRSLAESRDGALWVAHDRGLDRLAPGANRRFGRADGLPGLDIHALAEDAAGTLWVAGDFGVARRVGERFVAPDPAPQRPLAGARALRSARDGALWVGLTGGVAELRDGVWRFYDGAAGLPRAPIRDLLEDGRGALWIATYGTGLARLADGQARRLDAASGLPDHYLSRLLDDGLGFLWVTGNRGVYRVAWADLDAVAAGTRSAIAPLVLDTDDGMVSSECNGGGQPAGWRARDGRLWIPTKRGLAAIDPAAIPNRIGAPPVTIEEARVDGRRAAVADGALRLPAGADQLEVRYTALSFVAPESVRFRYRLDPHDADWIDAGGSRVALYRRLPPGRYRFEVAAAGDDGRFGGPAAALAVRVAPRIYETGWFRLAAVLVPLLAALTAHRWNTGRLERRQVELARLVEARTVELAAEKRRADQQVDQLARQEAELAELNRDLERRVAAQTTQLRVARDVAMLTLARLAELRDDATGRHLDRIASFSRELARALLIAEEDTLGLDFVDHLYRSSPLHDIGKVAIPDAILRKPGPLTEEERRVMESHTTIGGDTLRDIVERFDSHRFFTMGMEIAYHHHERWDGQGYPHGLAGEGIPLSARIVAIVDAYDAITSARPYKPAVSHDAALQRIVADRGTHFDPLLVDRFVAIAGRIDELREALAREP